MSQSSSIKPPSALCVKILHRTFRNGLFLDLPVGKNCKEYCKVGTHILLAGARSLTQGKQASVMDAIAAVVITSSFSNWTLQTKSSSSPLSGVESVSRWLD